jgi:hypothetical protein
MRVRASWSSPRSTSRGGGRRAILIRWDKQAATHLSLLKPACTLLHFRRYHRLAGLG